MAPKYDLRLSNADVSIVVSHAEYRDFGDIDLTLEAGRSGPIRWRIRSADARLLADRLIRAADEASRSWAAADARDHGVD